MDLERLRLNWKLFDYEVPDARIKKLVDLVIASIPDECEADFPPIEIYQSDLGCAYGGTVGTAKSGLLIHFNGYLLNRDSPDDDAPVIGIIAHEFAHAFLDHGLADQHALVNGGVIDTRMHELQADVLATKWGFGKEIKAGHEKLGHWKSNPRYGIHIYLPGEIWSQPGDEISPGPRPEDN